MVNTYKFLYRRHNRNYISLEDCDHDTVLATTLHSAKEKFSLLIELSGYVLANEVFIYVFSGTDFIDKHIWNV